MADTQTYECENCGNKAELSAEDAKTRKCCDQPMKVAAPLDHCTISTTAEHSRFDDFSEEGFRRFFILEDHDAGADDFTLGIPSNPLKGGIDMFNDTMNLFNNECLAGLFKRSASRR